jgi:glycerol kinase
MLPEPRTSSGIFGYTDPKIVGASIPISGVLGDQQAALFGQTAFEKGLTKCTYGTGNFLLMNTGDRPSDSNNLLTTIAWGLGEKVTYALEGSIFITGAAVQWLRDSLKIIANPSETEAIALKLSGNEGVYFVPALSGLGAPYWDQYARGLIIGLTRGTSRAHLIRATLEAIAYLTRDVSEALEENSGAEISELRVDGGASMNKFLMQFQADILGKKIVRPAVHETTALGAAYMAVLTVEYWSSQRELSDMWRVDAVFEPKMDEMERERLYRNWKSAVERALGWANKVA